MQHGRHGSTARRTQRLRIAGSGDEAVAADSEARFDLVFMNLQMPVIDGLTATRRMHELEAGGARPSLQWRPTASGQSTGRLRHLGASRVS